MAPPAAALDHRQGGPIQRPRAGLPEWTGATTIQIDSSAQLRPEDSVRQSSSCRRGVVVGERTDDAPALRLKLTLVRLRDCRHDYKM